MSAGLSALIIRLREEVTEHVATEAEAYLKMALVTAGAEGARAEVKRAIANELAALDGQGDAAALPSGLLHFVKHKPGCASMWRASTGSSQIGPCDCGLASAIARAGDAAPRVACDCGALLTMCVSCAVADYQAQYPDCPTCCPPANSGSGE